jgi:hypothetical protein
MKVSIIGHLEDQYADLAEAALEKRLWFAVVAQIDLVLAESLDALNALFIFLVALVGLIDIIVFVISVKF